MSSVPVLMRTREHLAPAMEWGKVSSEYVMTTEIEVGDTIPSSPIVVDGGKLKIESALLDIGRVYSFEYLGAQMVLWKLPNGAIDLFEIIEE